ncbi:hypothetical protein DK419_19500 [Methylobacterium terrae]|uniref:diguanylate cyclase n=1 Tax=Methylobacterium terrae TaxID=2202827 RepID=A0A2U8WSQ7_9HYPH|nr:GGDEF domain-containing protein [Methylobacterium terrae]AWN48262.1 hypothetical protein DK419_19500 [Methylobacterium terrae]
MISVSLAGNLLAVGIASQSLVPLRDVARLVEDPALKRGWLALMAAVVTCMALVAVKAFREAHRSLDADGAAQIVIHVVSGLFVVAIARLSRRTARNVVRLEGFEVQAFTDGLTGLGNRHMFVKRLDEETARAREAGTPLSLIVLDIDHFKQINDTYGHAVGDLVLQHVADRIAAATRNADTVCRIGGEEMVVIVPRIDPDQAAEMADALRAAIGAATVPVGDGRAVAATVSLGFATRRPEEGGGSLFDRADAALYAAKRGGRDRVALAA